MSVGNHEVWGDPKIEGTLNAVPYLKKVRRNARAVDLQVRLQRHAIYFPLEWKILSLFPVVVGRRSAEIRGTDEYSYGKSGLDDAKAKGMKKAFITFHYPVFCRAGLGPIPEPDNPHKVIAAYARDLELVVFNGHVHTTELYDVDGVKYLVLGRAGREQYPSSFRAARVSRCQKRLSA